MDAPAFCSNCRHFRQNKLTVRQPRFANGYWIGDGKCALHPKTDEWTSAGYTVLSNCCPFWTPEGDYPKAACGALEGSCRTCRRSMVCIQEDYHRDHYEPEPEDTEDDIDRECELIEEIIEEIKRREEIKELEGGAS